MRLTVDDIDDGFYREINRLADHATDMLPGGAEQPAGRWRRCVTRAFYEALEEALTLVEVQSPSDVAEDERVEQAIRISWGVL